MTNTQIATLPPTERAVAALGFDTVKAEVEKLATQYADITAISNKAGRDQAHSAAIMTDRMSGRMRNSGNGAGGQTTRRQR